MDSSKNFSKQITEAAKSMSVFGESKQMTKPRQIPLLPGSPYFTPIGKDIKHFNVSEKFFFTISFW